MSKSLNSVQLLGRLGKDPDMKTTDSGMQITTCSIATSRNVKNKATGKYDTELTDWHRVVFFDKLAGIVAQYLKKGSLTHITGRIQTRSWNENGVTKYITEIVANNMIMLDGCLLYTSPSPRDS